MNFQPYSPYVQNPYPYQPMQNQTFQYQNAQPSYLNGKFVDSIDVVRATEVPIGGYGIFPKADLSEVYLKSWNNDGTTKIVSFRPFVEQEKKSADTHSEILERISALDAKLEKVISDLST